MYSEHFSIVMPAFNSEATLDRAVKSILEQTVRNWELLIIDDCSRDATLTIAQNYSATDSRIRVFSNTKNLGVACTRNVGLSKATGRYVAFLDADDEWLPNRLSESLKTFEINSDAPLACSSYIRRREISNKILSTIQPPPVITWSHVLSGNPIGCLTVTIDRNKTGEIQFRQVKHEDLALWVEILYKFGPARSSPSVTAVYTVGDSSVSSKKTSAFKWYVARLWDIEWLSTLDRLAFLARYLLSHAIRRFREKF